MTLCGDTSPAKGMQNSTQIVLWLQIENNNKHVRGKGPTRRYIERFLLAQFDARKLAPDGWEYELTFYYDTDEDLEEQIRDLTGEMASEADLRNGFIECDFNEVGTDRRW